MGRGLGPTQTAIIRALTDSGDPWLTTADLAVAVGRSERQVRQACDNLVCRGLVVVEKGCIGWKGRGEYGLLREVGDHWSRVDWEGDEDLPRLVLNWGDPWPFTPETHMVGKDGAEFFHRGLPVYGRQVWLAERHRQQKDREDRTFAAIGLG